jgi:TonB family protein
MSLALHGGALGVIERMPRGWQLGELAPARFGSGVLQARLRAERSSSEQPDTLVALPARSASRAGPGTLPAKPVYLPANELDEKPLIRNQVEPEFPAGAPLSGGRVVLRLYIGETGQVDEIAVVSAQPGQVFEQAALGAFAAARFTPGRKNGEPVKSALTLELLFGAQLPVAVHKAAEGPLWQPARRSRSNASLRKETP